MIIGKQIIPFFYTNAFNSSKGGKDNKGVIQNKFLYDLYIFLSLLCSPRRHLLDQNTVKQQYCEILL